MNPVPIYPNLMEKVPSPSGIPIREDAGMITRLFARAYLFPVGGGILYAFMD